MKIINSFAFAWHGLKYSFITQLNFRIHLLLTAAAVLLGFVLHISITEWLVLMVCILVVLFAELLNTALEKLCDVVHPEIHPGIKLVKDIAAGAVLLSAAISFCMGIIIFLPRLLILIKHIS